MISRAGVVTFILLLGFWSWRASATDVDFSTLGKSCTVDDQLADCGNFLVCLEGTCSHCNSDAQCMSDMLVCTAETGGNACTHKPLFDDFHYRDALQIIIVTLAAALAISAGIGGGGVFVPTLILVLGFAPKVATAISQALVTGAALAGLIHNCRLRHPTRRRPLIDVKTTLVIAPASMAGAQIGVLINKLFPGWLVIVLMIIIMTYSVTRTIKKGIHTRRAEKAAREAEKHHHQEVRAVEGNPGISDSSAAGTADALDVTSKMGEGDTSTAVGDIDLEVAGEDTLPPGKTHARSHYAGDSKHEDESGHETDGAGAMSVASMNEFSEPVDFVEGITNVNEGSHRTRAGTVPAVDADKSVQVLQDVAEEDLEFATMAPEVRQMIEKERKIQWKWWGVILLVWCILIFLLIGLGGKGTPSLLGVKSCGAAYWIVWAAAILLLALVSTITGLFLRRETTRKVQLNYPFARGDVVWTKKMSIIYLIASLFSGMFGGLIGTGGGMVVGPVLLQFGFLPQVSAAITATSVILTSSSAASSFLISGRAPVDYAFFFFGFTFLGGMVGITYISHLVKKYKKSSIIIFLLAVIIILSVIMITAAGVITFINNVKSGTGLGFKGPC